MFDIEEREIVPANGQQAFWKFHWLTQWEEIWEAGFVRQWRAWLDSSFSAHVFFHPALVKAWVETYLPLRDLRPCFLIAQSDNHAVFFPLILWRRNWKSAFQRLLVPAGYADYDYHDPIVVGPERLFNHTNFWKQFIQTLETDPPVAFDRLQIDGIRQSLTGCSNDEQWREYGTCPWTDLRAFKTPDEFLPSLKSSLRGDIRRQMRRMSEVGKIEFLVFSEATEQQALQEIEPFLAAHTRRWPAAYKAPRFHKNLLHHGMADGVLHFSALHVGNNVTAWHLGFIFKDRFYYYLPAQEEEFERLSPGKVLLLKCIEDTISNKLSIFDFLQGEESYKTGWTDKSTQLFNLRLDICKLLSIGRNAIVDKFRS